jgi:putative ABC transport system permease protein
MADFGGSVSHMNVSSSHTLPISSTQRAMFDHMPLPRDVRHGIRALRATPAFTCGGILTIALAVGATTAMFSVVHAVLLRQLPYRAPDRVFWIWSDQPGRDRAPFNVPDFIDYRDAARTLSGFAGYFAYGANLSLGTTAERAQGLCATGNLFEVLGARAQLGRLVIPADEASPDQAVVVLTDTFWRRRFGGANTIVGGRST